MNFEKIHDNGFKNLEKYKKFSDWIVDNRVLNVVNDEYKAPLSTFIASSLAVGAEINKNKYILTGIGIGIVGTCLTMKISDKFKNRKIKNEEKMTEEQLEELQPEVVEPEKIELGLDENGRLKGFPRRT